MQLFEPTLQPFAFNVLADVPQETHPLLAYTILYSLKGFWEYGKGTPNIDLYVQASIQSLLSVPNSTLLTVEELLSDKAVRDTIVAQIKDKFLKRFWERFDDKTAKEQRDSVSSTLNKVWQYLLEPRVRACIEQKANRLSFSGITLVSLRDQLGTNAGLLGALVLAQLYITGNTSLFTTGDFCTAMLGKIFKNQTVYLWVSHLDEIPKDTKPMVLGGIGQIVAMQTSVPDGKYLEEQFDLPTGVHLHQLHPDQAYAVIDGRSIDLTMPRHAYKETHQVKKIQRRCKSQYGGSQ